MSQHKKKIIVFNQIPVFEKASGGGNAWAVQCINHLKKKNYQISHKLSRDASCIFINNSKSFFFEKNFKYFIKKKTYHFNYDDLKKFKKKYPKIPVIQRVNDTDAHRKSSFIDDNIMKVNAISDFTIYVSSWIRKYYLKKGMKPKKFGIICNSSDPKIFNLNKKIFWKKNSPFKIGTHHWSDNLAKGFNEYQALDRIIYEKKIKDIEFFIIGNVPAQMQWKATKIIKPLSGKKLSTKLKSLHAYITASKYEASAFHAIEAIQCGLPVLYFENSGNIAQIVNNKYGLITNNKDLVKKVLTLKKKYFFFVKNIKKINTNLQNKIMLDNYYKIIKNNLKDSKN